MRLVGERRALAAAVLAFFMIQFLLTGIFVGGPFRGVLVGLGVVYGAAFVGVVAGYFWARWYALGLAFSGVAMAAMTFFRTGELAPAILLIGITHAVIGLGLLGTDAATFYDGRRDWREKWKMDDNAVNKLGKAVTRAGASLPYLIIAGLAPKEDAGYFLSAGALIYCVFGLTALLRMRTLGVFLLGMAALFALAASAGVSVWMPLAIDGHLAGVSPWFAVALLGSAVLPFAAPMGRYLRAR